MRMATESVSSVKVKWIGKMTTTITIIEFLCAVFTIGISILFLINVSWPFIKTISVVIMWILTAPIYGIIRGIKLFHRQLTNDLWKPHTNDGKTWGVYHPKRHHNWSFNMTREEAKSKCDSLNKLP